MSKNRYLRAIEIAMLSSALSACGGGGGTSSPAASATPSAAVLPGPTPSPTPSPSPSAQPQSLRFAVFEVGVDSDGGGTFRVSAPSEPSGIEISLSDPDAPLATRFEDFTIDGDETIVTTGFGVRANLRTLAIPSSVQSTTMLFTQAGTLPRNVDSFGWPGSSTAEPAVLPLIDVIERLPATAAPFHKLPKHGRVFEVGTVDARALRVFGTRAPNQSIPTSGARRYVGEVFGTVYPTGGTPGRFVGDAILNVFFDGKPYVTGLIKFSQYERVGNSGLPLTVEFVADLVNGKLVTRSITVTGTGKVLQSGSVAGGLFGATAADLGFTVAVQGPSGIGIFAAMLEAN